jgi:hypothetical protein
MELTVQIPDDLARSMSASGADGEMTALEFLESQRFEGAPR